MSEPNPPQPEPEDRPPLGSWGRIYAVVIGNLVLLILLLIWFTRTFS
ncbi:MAG: hypothetical protein R3190_06870 [Thermoanaerobaculia bacterium]|nr:hypothetical protein [Thermoanaerobaculia bacterium]